MEAHYTLLNCCCKKIVFQKPREEEFTFQCLKTKFGKFFILALKVSRMIRRGCETFLASVVMNNIADKFVKDVKVVKEFDDVFSEDLFGLPPDREIEFSINLLPRSSPVSMVALE